MARTARLLGDAAMDVLKNCRVAVFGIGGVGGYAAEMLARSGVGAIDLIDNDTVSESNINRQIIALKSTVGKRKVDVMKQRISDISPEITVRTWDLFFDEKSADTFPLDQYDYIVDAIDTVTSKLCLIEKAKAYAVPVISCMGTGNKLCASMFRAADIYETSVCPLSRVMRRELKKRGIDKLKVVYSEEEPKKITEAENGRHIPASVSFVPPVAGCILAEEVIKDLVNLS